MPRSRRSSASPHGESSLRLAIADLFATKCATCGRTLAVDEVEWADGRARADPLPLPAVPRPAGPLGAPGGRARRRPTASAPRATSAPPRSARRLRERFPVPDGGDGAGRRDPGPAHGSPARRARGDPRPDRGRPARRAGRVRAAARVPARGPARRAGSALGGAADARARDRGRRGQERDPGSLARAEPVARLRGRLPRRSARSCSGSRAARSGPLEARLGTDLRSLVEGAPNAVVRVMTPGALDPRHEARDRAQARDRDGRAAPRGSGSSSASRRRGSARSGSAPRTTGRAGRSGARRRRCCRWSRCWAGRPGAVVVAGGRAPPLARGGRAASRPRRPGRPAARARRSRGARRGGPRRRRRRLSRSSRRAWPIPTTRSAASSS